MSDSTERYARRHAIVTRLTKGVQFQVNFASCKDGLSSRFNELLTLPKKIAGLVLINFRVLKSTLLFP